MRASAGLQWLFVLAGSGPATAAAAASYICVEHVAFSVHLADVAGEYWGKLFSLDRDRRLHHHDHARVGDCVRCPVQCAHT